MHAIDANRGVPPLVSVVVGPDGRAQASCTIPKSEAVKLLLNVVEELRLQAFREESSRVIQVASPMPLAANP